MEVGRSFRLGELLERHGILSRHRLLKYLVWTILGLAGTAGANFKFHKGVQCVLGPESVAAELSGISLLASVTEPLRYCFLFVCLEFYCLPGFFVFPFSLQQGQFLLLMALCL